MYVPVINQVTGRSEIIALMQQVSFATIVTLKENMPVDSHLPFVVTEENGVVVFTAHFAKANRHWMDIENGTAPIPHHRC